MLLFYEPRAKTGDFTLSDEESRHCVKVLRKTVGDRITVVDGKGTFYECEIKNARAKRCEVRAVSHRRETSRPYRIHLAIAPVKNISRMEWLVEKLTETGIDELSFVICENSERRQLNTERLVRKAISAMKQSLKATLPKINAPLPYSRFIAQIKTPCKYIAIADLTNPIHLKSVIPRKSDYCLTVGPEGDFSEAEAEVALEKNFIKVSLGNSRLRTETAGLLGCHIFEVVNA